MKIAIGSDKSGFAVKEAVKDYLVQSGIEFDDLGTTDLNDVHPYYRVASEVVLQQGTNLPLENKVLCTDGVGKLLRMKNKWLTCHPDSPQAANGAFAGITGENIDIEKP